MTDDYEIDDDGNFVKTVVSKEKINRYDFIGKLAERKLALAKRREEVQKQIEDLQKSLTDEDMAITNQYLNIFEYNMSAGELDMIKNHPDYLHLNNLLAKAFPDKFSHRVPIVTTHDANEDGTYNCKYAIPIQNSFITEECGMFFEDEKSYKQHLQTHKERPGAK